MWGRWTSSAATDTAVRALRAPVQSIPTDRAEVLPMPVHAANGDAVPHEVKAGAPVGSPPRRSPPHRRHPTLSRPGRCRQISRAPGPSGFNPSLRSRDRTCIAPSAPSGLSAFRDARRRCPADRHNRNFLQAIAHVVSCSHAWAFVTMRLMVIVADVRNVTSRTGPRARTAANGELPGRDWLVAREGRQGWRCPLLAVLVLRYPPCPNSAH
jgi:hypothetical protein